jgi:hypothetical protein
MASKKTEKQRESTVVRKKVVIELRAIRKEYPLSSRFFQLWRSVIDRTNADDGITRAEVAAAFYPNAYNENYDRAIYLAKELITHFQTWKRNKSVVLKALRKNRLWIYCNLQKVKELEKTEEHKKKVIQGLIDIDKRDLEILRLQPRRRKRLAEILLEEETLQYYGSS